MISSLVLSVLERETAGDRGKDLGLEFGWVGVYESAREVRSLAGGQLM